MHFWNLIIKLVILSQITTGIFINLFLLINYLHYYMEHTLKPKDLILMHLMAVNTLIVLSMGVPYTIAAAGLKQFVSDFGCRFILYIQKVSRSMSIGTTCLLSVFQAVIISQRVSCFVNQNPQNATHIGFSISFLWVWYIFIHFIFFVDIFVKSDKKNVTRNIDFEYCCIVRYSDINDSLYVTLVVCPEIFFSVLIAWSSGSMIVILYRHKQTVRHIHSCHVSRRNTPESIATKNIVILLSTFLAFYTVSSFLQCCIALLYNHNWWLVNITHLTSLGFPSFGPFVLMSHYSIMPRFSLV